MTLVRINNNFECLQKTNTIVVWNEGPSVHLSITFYHSHSLDLHISCDRADIFLGEQSAVDLLLPTDIRRTKHF
jgi:hypothetical protein